MIATSIEQSKKLLELGLDPKTADMWWNFYIVSNDLGHPMEFRLKEPWLGSFNWYNHEDNIPAWSLSALLELIPKSKNRQTSIHHNRHMEDDSTYMWGIIFIEDIRRNTTLCGPYYDPIVEKITTDTNLINAAVEMIEWLVDNGYLGKEEKK